jgi:hypothetical protein
MGRKIGKECHVSDLSPGETWIFGFWLRNERGTTIAYRHRRKCDLQAPFSMDFRFSMATPVCWVVWSRFLQFFCKCWPCQPNAAMM